MPYTEDTNTLRSILRMQQDMYSPDKIQELLGTPLWDEETLLKCHYGSLTNTRQVIETLDGHKVLACCFGLQKSFNILNSFTNDLLSFIERLKLEANEPGFWDEKDSRLNEIKFATEKALFAVSASAAALIEHQRRILNKGLIEKKAHSTAFHKFFGDASLSHFVVGLRNCMSHRNIIDCDWQGFKDFVSGKNDIGFYLKKEKLLNYNWKKDSKADVIPFIESHEFGIDIQAIFNDWLKKSTAYHYWLIEHLKNKYESCITHYSNCEKILYYEGIAAFLAVSSKTALHSADSSPSTVLSKDEVAEIQTLPSRKEQRVKLQSLYEGKYGLNPLERIFD